MSNATRSSTSTPHGDDWWGEAVRTPAPSRDVHGRVVPLRQRARRRSPLWMRVLQLPITMSAMAFERWPRLRRLALRLAVLAIIAGVIGGSVGVILLNNVVIRRTAELGRLDDERRELRRENAMLGAQAANRSSQAQVVRRAERELGMVRSPTAPHYTYLDPANVDVTPAQREARRRRAQLARERAATKAAAPGAAATATPPSTSTTKQAP